MDRLYARAAGGASSEVCFSPTHSHTQIFHVSFPLSPALSLIFSLTLSLSFSPALSLSLSLSLLLSLTHPHTHTHIQGGQAYTWHIWMSHVAHKNESRRTYESAMPLFKMSHVTHREDRYTHHEYICPPYTHETYR